MDGAAELVSFVPRKKSAIGRTGGAWSLKDVWSSLNGTNPLQLCSNIRGRTHLARQ